MSLLPNYLINDANIVLWTENVQHLTLEKVENKTFSFTITSSRLPDHVQVKVQSVQAAPGIHAMSRVTFSIETAFLLEDIITSSKSIRLQVVHHCFGSFIVHTMKKIK